MENDIDMKLIAFNKVGVGAASSSVAPTGNTDTSPLLGDHVFESLSLEIEQMLDKLSNINEKMSEIPNSGAAVMHVLQRHREILHVRARCPIGFDFFKLTPSLTDLMIHAFTCFRGIGKSI